jgi:hypothetical protein
MRTFFLGESLAFAVEVELAALFAPFGGLQPETARMIVSVTVRISEVSQRRIFIEFTGEDVRPNLSELLIREFSIDKGTANLGSKAVTEKVT